MRANDPGELAFRYASSLIDGLVDVGIGHAVVSPGSRSTPLALACLRCPDIDTRVVVDERSAAFFALGMARASGTPVLVVATSGSAPANWHPAVIEADGDDVPLVLVSADRPPELQDCGANQTTTQKHLFAHHVRAFLELGAPETGRPDTGYARTLGARAGDLAQWPRPGPVHVNAAFREPLVPVNDPGIPARAEAGRIAICRPALVPDPVAVGSVAELLAARPGVIVCGPAGTDGFEPESILGLGEASEAPILADPLSGLRCGPWPRHRLVTRYDAFLRGSAPGRPGWVLRFGGTPTSRPLQDWLASSETPRPIVVAARAPWPDPSLRAERVIHADPSAVAEALSTALASASHEGWMKQWRRADDAASAALEALPDRPAEATLMQSVLDTAADGMPVFVGNSMAIREADAFLAGRERALPLFGNRGVSGIDGNISTASGIAAASNTPTLAILGDLAVFHDLNALALAADLPLTVVVINNGGGAIFGYLPQRSLPEFEQAWLTPTGLDLAGAARLFGLGFQRVPPGDDPRPALETAMAENGGQLVELVVDCERSRAAHEDWWRAATP